MSTLRVCIISTPIIWENIEANLTLLAAKVESCSVNSLIVLPEVFATGFSMNKDKVAQTMQGSIVQWLLKQSTNKIVCGSVFITDGKNTYNRFIWANNGAITHFYDKKHLFSLGKETENYQAGNSKTYIPMENYFIEPFICYDLRFPVWNRITNVKTKVYVYVANWPKVRNYAWETLLKARAIENQVFIIACNCIETDGNGIVYEGPSGIIDPLGNWLVKTNKEEILEYTLDLNRVDEVRNDYPFLLDKDGFSLE